MITLDIGERKLSIVSLGWLPLGRAKHLRKKAPGVASVNERLLPDSKNL